jgi:outer membrane protein OmpA-like peptidoglycan-associated protein
MGKYFTKLFLLVLITVFTHRISLALSEEHSSNCNDCSESKYLFAATIEAASGQEITAKTDDKSIGIKKNIRIINLGPVVNWKGLDYAPTVSADGRTLFFVSNRPGSKLNLENNESHDFWAAKKSHPLDTVFQKPYNIDTTTNWGELGVNTIRNEGAASIAADRQTLFFTGCNRPDGLGKCDIYRTEIQGDKWGKPINLGRNVNSKYWDSQPSISPDKKRLYFVSNRPGPHGDDNFDIWYSDWDDELMEFKPAQNLVGINTPGSEVSPFIAADGVTLFFASDYYKPNIGKKDFYVSRYNPENNTWSEPVNLGEPINTPEDEYFITLPASGDVIYFSSSRKDLPGYQGDLDLFMAFVPTFFRAINVITSVVDECSGVNIPATITIKNPITGRVVVDSLTLTKNEVEMIVSNADYGNPKDSIKFVDFEITAENPKYGKKTKIERVFKPEKTENIEETKVFASEIKVQLTLGQRPQIASVIEQGEYAKSTNEPELKNFKGLMMVERLSWKLFPLLNYVFFDLGSSTLPERYIQLMPNEIKSFTDSTIPGGTLDKYWHLLNIYGFRLTNNPDVKIEIVGCNDGVTAEEKRTGLSAERAQAVYDYFKNVWHIDESRMKITVRNQPLVISNLKDSLGIQENRRVEILCSDWEVTKPVFEVGVVTNPEPPQMKFTLKNGIEDEIVTKRRIEITYGKENWKTITSIGTIEPNYTWNWQNEKSKFPKDEQTFTAQLIVTTNSGAECNSDPIQIPVKQIKRSGRIITVEGDSTDEVYNLILFPFDKFVMGPNNERIMKDYVYSRCLPESKIFIEGHTDVVGLDDHNLKLSEKRAGAVYDGVMKQTGGKVNQINSIGVGENEPLYDNMLPEGRFYNRTVQVRIKTPVSAFK